MSSGGNGTCPNCGVAGLRTFYELAGVPVHSVLLFPDHGEAVEAATGDISLTHCAACDFVHNAAFRPETQRYGPSYESTQALSATFHAFHRKLAEDLVAKYDLHGREIIEIGCGQGEFLELLCELGPNRGYGFDPAFDRTRQRSTGDGRVSFIQDYYSERYAHLEADLVCCKMTLEHVGATGRFLETVRRCIGERHDTAVFFMVPDATRIMTDLAFWDVYYEHCSYFSDVSLARLFSRCGFDVMDLRTEYHGQYLAIEARPGTGTAPAFDESLAGAIARFESDVPTRMEAARRHLENMKRNGRRVVLWGGGSKAVALLSSLGIDREVEAVVDINPRKQGTFLPGAGHQVVAPQWLRRHAPDAVVVMNPVYMDEIGQKLHEMGLSPVLIPVEGLADAGGAE